MKDIWTLYKFLQSYYKNIDNKKEKSVLLEIVKNMCISNYTIGQLKRLMGNDTITNEEIIVFLKDPNNINKIFDDSRTARRTHFPRSPIIVRSTTEVIK